MKSFRLINVKSFEDTGEIELKPITIFVGPNSSGKSSLLRFPVVIGQTYLDETTSPLVFHGKYVDYGNFEDVVHDHSGDRIQFSLWFDTKWFRRKVAARISYPDNIFSKHSALELQVTTKKQDEKLKIHEYTIKIDDITIFSVYAEESNYKSIIYAWPVEEEVVVLDTPFSFFIPIPKLYKFVLSVEFGFHGQHWKQFKEIAAQEFKTNDQKEEDVLSFLIESAMHAWGRHRKLTDYPFIEISQREHKSLNDYLDLTIMSLHLITIIANNLNSTVERFAERMYYIGPFRTNPERIYRQSESVYDYVGKDGQNSMVLLRQLEKNQHSPAFKNVSNWFTKAMGYQIGIEEVPQSNYYRIKAYSEQNPNGDNLIDVGYGISQILPIVTQLYSDRHVKVYRGLPIRSETFFIEQPEIHLHPKAQAELADLFVSIVSEGHGGSQVIIETHSEHLVRRLQSIVADPDQPFSADDVAIYYVDRAADGNSSVTRMDMHENGQFKTKWPSGFFDKGYELSKELIRNASKRATA